MPDSGPTDPAPPDCSNFIAESGEVCDDGNNVNGDGCSADCQSDETCGNGIPDYAAGETCDDGNLAGGDGCNTECLLESCGNERRDLGEECDDGNTTSGDGCSADCQSDETCGNGVLDPGEECDDDGVCCDASTCECTFVGSCGCP